MNSSASAISYSPFVFWRNLSAWKKIFIAMVLGIIVGALLGPKAEYLKPIGDLFINAIKMLIVPLVFCSLISGITAMRDTAKMSRVGGKAIIIYLLSTAIAVSIGLAFGLIFAPGEGMQMTVSVDAPAVVNPLSLADTMMNLIPSNPVQAMASGNLLQIIVFAIGLGLSMNLLGKKADPAIALFKSFAEIMYRFTALIMSFAPYGIFALMAWLAGKYGLDLLFQLSKVIGVVYFACMIQVLVVMSLAVKFVARLSPIRFLKGIIEAAIMSFSTASSSGTLPVSMKCANKNLGVSKEISSFTLPLGTTINMDGTAIYLGVSVLFIAQAYGIELTMADYITIVVMATVASIGSAGVPGAGIVMMSLVLTTVGLPMEGLAIIAGIDRILDMGRTCVNVCGDLMVTTLIGKSENELDINVYNESVNS